MPQLTGPDGTSLWFGHDLVPERRNTPGADRTRPVVVLCPPGGRNAAYWPARLVDSLVGGGVEVVRPDWRGQGRSRWDVGPVSAAQLVDDLLSVVGAVVGDAEPSDRPLMLVGAGLGGWVAARAARSLHAGGRRPAHLVAVGSSGRYADPGLPGPTEPTVVSLVLRRRGGGPDDLTWSLAREIAVEAARPGPVDGSVWHEVARSWTDHGYNPDDGHRVAWLAAPDLGADLGADPVPPAECVTVLHGADDPVVPVVHGERLAGLLGGTFHVVPGVGHHLTGALLDRLIEVLVPADRAVRAAADGRLGPYPPS
jgi:alpha-beta hydrolase superfamily lysophospholipase